MNKSRTLPSKQLDKILLALHCKLLFTMEETDPVVTLLCDLCEKGDFNELHKNLTDGNCGKARNDGMTPLMCAAQAGGSPSELHRTCAQLVLINSGDRDVRKQLANAATEDGLTCLHYAAANDNVAVVELLLREGSKVNSRDNLGRSPLLFAVARGNVRTAEVLLMCGADQFLEASVDGMTPRSMALVLKYQAMIDLLDRWLPTTSIRSDFQEISRSLISSGDFSEVFRVQSKPDFPIVVRVVKVSTVAKREHEEAGLEALKKTCHPNIVQFIRTSSSQSQIEAFLEFVDGKTLEEHIKLSPLTEEQIKCYIRQIANALSYLHNHPNGRIIHRDIKCDNIMLTVNGVVKLVDFGFSLALKIGDKSVHRTTTQLGTISHMAPELLEDEEEIAYSCSSDIWAFGCVIFTMVRGQSPFGGNLIAALKAIARGAPNIDPENKLSEGIRDVYKKCTEKNPQDRISAVEIVLHEYLQPSTLLSLSVPPSRASSADAMKDLLQSSKVKLRQWGNDTEALISALQEIANEINRLEKHTSGGKVGGAVVAVAGGITAIVGCALLIPSFGAALPLVITGAAVATVGGTGAAASDLTNKILGSRSYSDAISKVEKVKLETDDLLFNYLLSSICQIVQKEIRRSAFSTASCSVDFHTVKQILQCLSNEVRTRVQDLIIDAALLEDADVNRLREDLNKWLSPVYDTMSLIDTLRPAVTDRKVNRESSDNFCHLLNEAVRLFKKMLNILVLGSSDQSSDIVCLQEINTVARAAANGAQIAAEAAGAVGKAVLPRALGVVGAAVFTVVDIGFLVYYSKQLHDARMGKDAKLASQVLTQKQAFSARRDQIVALSDS